MADKILVIRFSSLGDLILTTPFFKNLKLNLPGSFVYLLTREEYIPVFKNNPNIDRFIIFNGNNFFKVVKESLMINPDLVFDLHNSLRTFFIKLMFLDKRRVYTVDKRIKERRMILRKRFSVKIPHSREWFIELLKNAGFEILSRDTEIFLTRDEVKKMENLLIAAGIRTEKIITCFIDSKWKNKTLKEYKWIKLIENLTAPFVKIILLGLDKSSGERIISSVRGKTKKYIINLAGKLSLREVFSVVKLSHLVISPDSAGTHIANALNVPSLVFFGPTVKEFGFYPYGKNDVIIEKKLKCRPCHLHGGDICKREDLECMNIDEEEIADIVKEKLNI